MIRGLYNDDSTDNFTLDNCYRCTEVIINATNSLLENVSKKGFLKGREKKKFLLPPDINKEKISVNKRYSKIDYLPVVNGEQLIYQLSKRMYEDKEEYPNSRLLIIAPSFLNQTLYDGLLKKGFSIVEFELFIGEKRNKIKHEKIIESFNELSKHKTDNLALRKILSLYLDKNKQMNTILDSYKHNKGIWNSLSPALKKKIEKDIALFKKVWVGKDELNSDEIIRFTEIFNLKKILSKMLKGFTPTQKDAIEVEMTTSMKSKGLSADFVYYIGIDDFEMLDIETKMLNEQKICEFLVSITRAEKKLTLITLENENPKILDLIDKSHVNKIQL